MRLHEITLKSLGSFGTPLKGDTIFGQFCWQVARDKGLLGIDIQSLVFEYSREPRIIFSSAFLKFYLEKKYKYALKRPDLPLSWLFQKSQTSKHEAIQQRKILKRKRWMLVDEDLMIPSLQDPTLYADDQELLGKQNQCVSANTRQMTRDVRELVTVSSQSHNTINRLTGATGEGAFAPFALEHQVYFPEMELALFVGLDDGLEIDGVVQGLKRIGLTGFGRDASTGLGRFDVAKTREIPWPHSDRFNACYTLGPCVPEAGIFPEKFFTPFIRFGKHGDALAKSRAPFKNPVIMADEGAVLVPDPEARESVFSKPYVGSPLTGLSKAMPETIGQGYSLYIPVRMEAADGTL